MQLLRPCAYFLPGSLHPGLSVAGDEGRVMTIPTLFEQDQRKYYRRRVVEMVCCIVQLRPDTADSVFAPFVSLQQPLVLTRYMWLVRHPNEPADTSEKEVDMYRQDYCDWRAEFSVTLAIESLDDALDHLRKRTNKRKPDSS